ncbi:LysR substrate-binding domain-containing protein [Candidatus Methylospira mobilis]|uniref:LysR substrate-binding domain-containing protein n=1 Tax=Candidatus Methylospira mobilis TaxID=1808979 RepID=UPI0028E1E5B5|nr:LysR substrate-binding domain-containing protein [Candidatus Methylospira mobilis]WNV05759.1 LysR substrate-binding domain-containing protein [Candidatus Methylospira mobilis]
MNLRDLQYLIAVADLRSFGQAAERCFISQPTLSTQIKKLEEALGIQLFERSNKKVLPTEIGEQIIGSARRMLEEEQIIKELAASARDPLAGNLRLGAFPTLAPYLFPQLVPLIRRELPKIRLMLIEDKTDTLLRQLSSGQIDAALLAMPVEDESLQITALFEDEFLLAVACGHPLANKTIVTLDDLTGLPLLLLDEGHCLRGQALQICQTAGLSEQQDVRATSLETLRQMARAGTGITLIPAIAVREEDGLCYRPFQAPPPRRTIALVWRKTTARRVLFEKLVFSVLAIRRKALRME